MNWVRYWSAVAVAVIVTLVIDVLLNAIAFRRVYADAAPYLLPPHLLNQRVWLGWLSLCAIVVAFGYLFTRGPWRGVAGGLRFAAIFMVANVAGMAGFASLVPWPTALLVAIGIQQVANSLVLGLVFGGLYRPAGPGVPGRGQSAV